MSETGRATADAMLDLLVIGGGINGAAIARDAAGRGYRVALAEAGDLAGGTSSASTKLIHGGLRYLAHGRLRLVREALRERAVLMRTAPHLVTPRRFVIPHDGTRRPLWQLRLGLVAYARLGGRLPSPADRSTPAPERIADALAPGFTHTLGYTDCATDDARLVVLNVLDAAARGAEVLTRTELVNADAADGAWVATLCDARTGRTQTRRARALVNAAGPWVCAVATRIGDITHSAAPVRLIKGSHIVLPRLYEGSHAYLFQHTDRRVVFAIPYEGAFTLVGTTDVEVETPDEGWAISPAETAYLCDVVNRYLRRPANPADVVWSFAGLRALQDSATAGASELSREEALGLSTVGGAPVLTVLGGKLTTHRRLAARALAALARPLGPAPGRGADGWTAEATLPGGDGGPPAACEATLRAAAPWLPAALAARWAATYGTRASRIIGDAARLEDLGPHLGDGLHAAEVAYLVREEWAETADDILWRRTKLGLKVSEQTARRLAAHLDTPRAPHSLAS